MATDRELYGDTLEGRYATDHVGGAFNAKNLLPPKSVDKALEQATMGRKADASLMTQGFNDDRYLFHDEISPEKKPTPMLESRAIPTRKATPSYGPTRNNIVTSVTAQGCGGRPRYIPKKPNAVSGIVTYAVRQESGIGKPGTPIAGQPRLVPEPPFGPIIDGPPTPIYWDTDPDIWDLSKLIGPTYWDGADEIGY